MRLFRCREYITTHLIEAKDEASLKRTGGGLLARRDICEQALVHILQGDVLDHGRGASRRIPVCDTAQYTGPRFR